MSSPETPHKRTARAIVDHFNTKNYTALADLLHPDFKREVLSASLRVKGQTKEEFLDLLTTMVDRMIESFNLRFEASPLQDGNTVILHVKADGKTVSGKPYENEYILFLTFDGSGEKVLAWKESMDSKYTVETAERELGSDTDAGKREKAAE